MNQPDHPVSRRLIRRFALKVSLTYAVFGATWILASDHVLALLIPDAAMLSRFQTYKGWTFIAITAFLLYLLIRMHTIERASLEAGPQSVPTGRVQRMVAFATFLLITVILTNLVYNVWDERRGLIGEAEREAQNLAQALEEQTIGLVNAVDLTLMSSEPLLGLDRPARRVNDASVVERLRNSLKSLPFVRAIFITDENGRMIYDTDSFPATKLDFSDREYFQVHRDELVKGLHISHPLFSRTRNIWFISMSRRLTHADGSFAGVVVAAVEPRYIEGFYRSIKVGRSGTVSLFLRDGIMLVRSPYIEGAIGKSFLGSPLFTTHLPKAAVGTYQAPSLMDGSTRFFSYRTVPGRPLVVVIGLDRDEVLAKWLSRAWAHGLASVAFMLIIAWLGYLMSQELRRRDLLTNALRSSEERYRRALDDMMEGCQIIGFDWRYLYVNDTLIQHGRRARSELMGRTMMEVYPGLESTEVFASLRRAMEERVSQGLHTKFMFEDGSYTWFDISVQPVPEGIFILSIDITSQKFAEEGMRRLNEQLEARVVARTAALDTVNKELEAFGYSVSHDLRAPLRHLDGFARLAIERIGDSDDKTREYLTKISRSSAKMGDLIDDLLALSRASRLDLNAQPVDLQALVSGVREECMHDAGQRNIEWQIGTLPQVQGDQALLRQVFTNLLSNAIKFTRNCEQAVIEVHAELTADNEVQISVRDNGAGFDMRYADKLYGVFQRLHHESEFEGTGIGLAIVRRIVERHGGKVWAVSAPGDGAVFYLTLKLT